MASPPNPANRLLFGDVIKGIVGGARHAVAAKQLGLAVGHASHLFDATSGSGVKGRKQDWWNELVEGTETTRLDVLKTFKNWERYKDVFAWHYERLPKDSAEAILRTVLSGFSVDTPEGAVKLLIMYCFKNFKDCVTEELATTRHAWHNNLKDVKTLKAFLFDDLVFGQSRMQIILKKIESIQDEREKHQALYYLDQCLGHLTGIGVTVDQLKEPRLAWRKAAAELLKEAITQHVGKAKFGDEYKRLSEMPKLSNFRNVMLGKARESEVRAVVDALQDIYGWKKTYDAECEGTVPPVLRSEHYNPVLAKSLSRLRTLRFGD